MRQTISGLIAAVAVVTASAVPAMACGGGLFGSSCSPCGAAYVSPCAQTYVPSQSYAGCDSGCGGWAHERLPDPEQQYYTSSVPQQYYYVNQGPTYTGPGNFAPYPTYQEGAVSGWDAYRARPHFRSWRPHGYRYGYAPRYNYGPRYSQQYYAPRHSTRYYGPRERVLRRYY
jgi:hypothetical protein